MGQIARTIKRFPNPVRRIAYAAIPFRHRWDGEYRRILDTILQMERWPRADIEAWQRARLHCLIAHAYENVPYYRRVMDERGLTPADIQGPEDLPKLPLLDKATVRERGDELRASTCRKIITMSTSGSTGEPLTLIGDATLYQMEAAFITRAYRAHGTKLYGEKVLWMRSYAPPGGGPIHYHNPEIKRHYLSAFHLSASAVETYKRIIDKTRCRCLSTYPSAAYALAMLLDRANLRFRHIKVVHVASEQLLPQWVPLIGRVIGPVYDHYGMMEKVALFHRCPLSDGLYHENLEYGITEIVGGEVVGTGLWNFAMPLIRYRTGDLAEPNDGEQQCACGRGLPLTVKAFTGRSDDILITPDGRYIPSVNFYTMMYKTAGVGMFQIVQDSPSHVTALIVPNREFVPTTLTKVADGLRQRLGKNVSINVRAVNGIDRNAKTGKVRCVRREFALTSMA